MSQTPFRYAESLRIGTVDFVSPDEIKVALDIEAPESVALNAGGPRPFPRVNSYVLIPVDDSCLVGQIEWLTVERSPFPKRRGMQDFGLVDLPYPLRRMSLNPIGTLRNTSDTAEHEEYSFRRGADALPSVGANVLLPTDTQLRSIVESGEGRRVLVGTSPLAGNANVCVDPDRLFGRHLAILGNTGSGKSCSVAGLIRWSLESASEDDKYPNARFVVLDPNGEYSRTFADPKPPVQSRVFRVTPDLRVGEFLLQVPIWFWNSAEWCSFTEASTKTQRPTLIQALQAVRDGQTEPAQDKRQDMRRFLRTMLATLRMEKNSGTPWGSFPRPKAFFEKIEKWKKGLEADLASLSGEEPTVSTLVSQIEEMCVPRRVQHANLDFTKPEVDTLITLTSKAYSALGGNAEDTDLPDVDAPRHFNGESLLRSVEATAEMLNVSEYAETLLIRIRSLLANTRMKAIIGSDVDISLTQWLEDYIGGADLKRGPISVIDLSLVPSEVVQIITAVVARMVFEALQRYRKIKGVALPTVLVMEEAHTFIKTYREDAESHQAACACCQVFERIAREGRKYGLGLVLSSQRPSELSPTVLSQCNSFLLHRISNDRDQELVHRLVPDNLRGLLRELPSLPSQNAILLGWASELPVLVKMKDLPRAQQPHSADPDFWNVWTGKDASGNVVERKADWKPVADDWQGSAKQASTVNDTPEVAANEQ